MDDLDVDNDEQGFRAEIRRILQIDDDKRFVSVLDEMDNSIYMDRLTLSDLKDREMLLCDLWHSGAVKCAATVLNGEFYFKVDVNVPNSVGFYPLHYAAESGSAHMVEFLLSQGARTDVRCEFDDPDLYQNLPLHLAFRRLCHSIGAGIGAAEKSLLMVITELCQPHMEYTCLKSIRLLAWSTKETEEVFLQFVRHEELFNLAGLLMVARKKLSPVLTSAAKEAAATPVLQLLNIFERAGDAIEAYSKQERTGFYAEQTRTDVMRLLQGAGIMIDHSIQSRRYECISERVRKQLRGRVLIPGPPELVGIRTFDNLLVRGYRCPPFSQTNMYSGKLRQKDGYLLLNEAKNKVKGGERPLGTISSRKILMLSGVIKRFIKRI